MIKTDKGFKVSPGTKFFLLIVPCIFGLIIFGVLAGIYDSISFLIAAIVSGLLLVPIFILLYLGWNAPIHFEADRIWQKKWNKIYSYDWECLSDCNYECKDYLGRKYYVINLLFLNGQKSLEINFEKQLINKITAMCLNENVNQKLAQIEQDIIKEIGW